MRLFSETERLAAANTFDHLLHRTDAKRVFAEAGIQSSYIPFEFWAHLAYRGCMLFVQERPRSFTSNVLRDDELARFASAVADIATRLRFSSATKDDFCGATTAAEPGHRRTFALAHAEDARMIREGLVLWKPVFSSELLCRAFPDRDGEIGGRLGDQTNFSSPFARRHDDGTWSYLSALGGYGFALPRGAHGDTDSIRALTNLFMINPRLVHPYVGGMLDDERSETVTDFVQRHARPRWPFWLAIETRLTELLFAIFLRLDRTSDVEPLAFWNGAYGQVEDVRTRALIAEFLASCGTIGREYGWMPAGACAA